MSIFSAERRPPERVRLTIPANQKVYLVSDLHLGDGGDSDVFGNKDEDFLNFLRHVQQEGAHLVIGGDAVDLHQAWSFTRVVRAHGEVFAALSDHAAKHGVTYIWGNHDEDISLFRDLLRMDVCSSLAIGDEILIQHGYEYDPMIGVHMQGTHTATVAHHLVERLLGTWIRLPLENFYTRTNRVAFWLGHKGALLNRWILRWGRGVVFGGFARHMLDVANYWIRSQLGDPGGLYASIRKQVVGSQWRYLVTGHSHLPGIVSINENHTYVNTGSWTFGSATYAVWDGQGFEVKDWKTERVFSDQAYRHLEPGLHETATFFDWWKTNYLGWLRYRPAEERRLQNKGSLAAPRSLE